MPRDVFDPVRSPEQFAETSHLSPCDIMYHSTSRIVKCRTIASDSMYTCVEVNPAMKMPRIGECTN